VRSARSDGSLPQPPLPLFSRPLPHSSSPRVAGPRWLPHPIVVSRHAIHRWQDRVDPNASAGAIGGEIARFVRSARVVQERASGARWLANWAWPGIRLVVEDSAGHLRVLTVHWDPQLRQAV
jgi:hypothetical protein